MSNRNNNRRTFPRLRELKIVVNNDAIFQTIGEQLNSIIARLSKLDSIESSVRNIETNLANLKARTGKLEEFEATAKNGIAELKKSCSFNGDKCKEHRDALKKQMEEQNKRITSLIESERKLTDQINDITSKNLYLKTNKQTNKLYLTRVTLNSEITDKPVALGFHIELEFGNVGF